MKRRLMRTKSRQDVDELSARIRPTFLEGKAWFGVKEHKVESLGAFGDMDVVDDP